MTPPSPLVAVLLAFVLLVAATAAAARDLLVATVTFGAYGLGLAILWVVFRAPDVGLTEAAVGAGVTTSLFLAAVAVVVALGVTLPALPAVGDPGAPAFADDAAAAYYLDGTAALGIDNVVTAVLVVFRGFDTFGEIAVVFAAGVSVVAVFRGRRSG